MTKKAKRRLPFGTISVPPRSRELINQSLDGARISSGRLVHELEERFASLLGAREAVALSSGTDADILALAVLHDYGAQRGDEVIVPALSFVATGNAVFHAGFTPVFVDVERHTLNIDPARIEAAITPRTRAIMPVHLMGKPAAMDEIMAIAKRHGLAVVEDAAEAHGALYRGKPVGTIGAMGAFSLYVAHIITTGEGGMVVTDDPGYAEVLRSLRSHGRACKCGVCTLNTASRSCAKRFSGEAGEDIRFVFERLGYSSKMNELEAAIGLGNLDSYEAIVEKRRKNLLHVLSRFGEFAPHLATIAEEPHERIGPHAIPIIIGEQATFSRADLTAHLEGDGIDTRTLFASMPTQCPGFAHLGHRLGEFPCSEYLGRRGLHVGVHQDLSLDDMDYLLDSLRGFLAGKQA
jgi:dTDP-4-amino-4,6-dideoxygalactose transaminase